jgi:hypothetical protein
VNKIIKSVKVEKAQENKMKNSEVKKKKEQRDSQGDKRDGRRINFTNQ